MNALMLQAELAQARNQLNALLGGREMYVRLTICLANLIRHKAEAKIVNGNVAIDLKDYVDVPTKWQVGIEQGKVKAEGAPPEEKGEEIVTILVTPKIPAPVLAVPQASNGHAKILTP